MVNVIPITKARVNLGSVIKKVHLGHEYFIIEKDGYPVAGIMNIDEFEDYLELNNSRIKKMIAISRKEHLAGKTSPAKRLLRELKV